jgi:hypothetical protein
VRAAFAWRHAVDLDAYDRRVGVHVLGDTYPGLNSYPDKLRDVIPGPGRMTAPSVQLLVGINRRGTVALRVPIEASGDVTLVWNDSVTITRSVDGRGTLELTGLVPRREVNVLEIRAPVGSVVAPIDITARP